MLVIRDAQLRVFDDHARARFEARMLVHLPEAYPEQVRALGANGAVDDVLRRLVQEGERLASEWSVRGNEAREALLELMLKLGPTFYARPELDWAARLLWRGGGDGDGRVLVVRHALLGPPALDDE